MAPNCEHWASRYIDSLWSETTETWEDAHEDWRVVGSNPFRRRLESARVDTDPEQTLYIIEFPSKRLDIAAAPTLQLARDAHVILEADRGEDCGLVKGTTTRAHYQRFLRAQGLAPAEIRIKQIYRLATERDMAQLAGRRALVQHALCQCRAHVRLKGLPMEITDCEYQFDLNKITFFYRSAERIDFRELVKELYRTFKTRIWMCSMEKSKDRLLNDLIVDRG